jgi:hypothetical protein
MMGYPSPFIVCAVLLFALCVVSIGISLWQRRKQQ